MTREKRKHQSVHLNAYLRIGKSLYKVKELSQEALLLDKKKEEIIGKSLKATLIIPINKWDKVEIKGINLLCAGKGGKTLCYFKRLTQEQKKAIKALIKEIKHKNLVPVTREFTNYMQEEKAKELILYIKKQLQKKRIKLPTLLISLFLGCSFIGFFIKILTFPSKSPNINLTKENHSENINANKHLKTKKDKASNTTEETHSKSSPFNTPQVKETKQTTPQKGEERKEVKLSEEEDYLCIQVASGRKPSWLIKLSKNLKGLPFVRVERIGKAYTLRVGFFKEKEEAKATLKEIKKRYPSAFLRTCAYRPKRWIHSEK